MYTFREHEGVPAMTWCLRFAPDVFGDWKDNCTIYMWERKNQSRYAKARADEQRYIQEAYEDVEMGEPEDEREEEAEEEDEEGPSSEAEDQESDSESENFAKGSKNEQLAVGYKNDLSFVTRGDMIGVFAHTNDRVKYRTTIDRVKDMKGKSFSPRKVRFGE